MVNGKKVFRGNGEFAIPEEDLVTSNKEPAGLFDLFIDEGSQFGTVNRDKKRRRTFKVPSRPDSGFDKAFMPENTQFLAEGNFQGKKLSRLFK